MVDALDRTMFRPVVISMTTIGSAKRWIHSGDVEMHAVGKRAGNDLRAVVRLAQLLKRLHVNVLHSHNWPTLLEAAVAKRQRRPFHLHIVARPLGDDKRPHAARSTFRYTPKSSSTASNSCAIRA